MVDSLYHRYNFAIEVAGFDLALFTKSNLPSAEFETISFSSAGSKSDQKVAGRITYADIVLEKGVKQDGSDDAALKWFNQVLGATGVGADPQSYMKNIDIVQYNAAGLETRRFTLHGAWPKKIEYGDADASVNENVIEMVTLVYQYFTSNGIVISVGAGVNVAGGGIGLNLGGQLNI